MFFTYLPTPSASVNLCFYLIFYLSQSLNSISIFLALFHLASSELAIFGRSLVFLIFWRSFLCTDNFSESIKTRQRFFLLDFWQWGKWIRFFPIDVKWVKQGVVSWIIIQSICKRLLLHLITFHHITDHLGLLFSAFNQFLLIHAPDHLFFVLHFRLFKLIVLKFSLQGARQLFSQNWRSHESLWRHMTSFTNITWLPFGQITVF